MTVVQRLAACLVCLVVLVPRLALALELGPIEARSALYEPLDARIPIRDAHSSDVQGLNVMLGSPAQFELAGVPRLQHLNLLEFVVVGQDGGAYIRVRTDEPIIEPSLTFLIDVDWPRGRTVRGYRLRLSQAAAGAASTRQDRRTESETQPASDTDTAGTSTSGTGTSGTGATDAAPASPSGSSANEYGPVKKSDTLWSIAARLRPDRSISVQRMMLAILETNPEAFEFSNVNALNAGTTLRIPARDEIGPDELTAAIAEVQRQHSAWAEYRQGTRTTPTPATATPAPAPGDSETEPAGRVEVVSPEATATDRDEGAGVEALRRELALAMEEADAGRQENDELKLRLADAETHIRELNQLVALKNQEIAALQAELETQAETAPQADMAPAEADPAPAPEDSEPKPVLTPQVEEANPESAPAEVQPAPAETPAEVEPKSLPGLGALPVNPVYLVGGAGLLLILLGVVALLRRRRTSADEDDVLDVAEPSPPDEDNLLLELEAVAAELADEADDPRRRPSRTAPAVGAGAGMLSMAVAGDDARSNAEDAVEERVAALWKDDRAAEDAILAETATDDDASEMTFDIDALTEEDADLSVRGDDASDDFDISDLADLADLAAEREADSARSADDSIGNLDLLFDRHEADAFDSEASAPAPASYAGESSRLDSGIPDQESASVPRVSPAGRESPGSESGVAGTTQDDADSPPAPASVESIDHRSVDGGAESVDIGDVDPEGVDDGGVDVEPASDDRGDSRSTPRMLLGETTDGGESEAFALEDFGEDEVQTKIDLAQVYMEMGDTESARGFLEAVLLEGNPEQQ
ncbi:MAG: LysM peptidoglycan-binding domain-containing protein, partial [Thiotrichales bacterium]|nr:LysM peptidoglycan-binding domain-containing protein [Thiotrichales bacterium]